MYSFNHKYSDSSQKLSSGFVSTDTLCNGRGLIHSISSCCTRNVNPGGAVLCLQTTELAPIRKRRSIML